MEEAITKAVQVRIGQSDADEKERIRNWQYDINRDDAQVIRWINNYNQDPLIIPSAHDAEH